MTDVVVTVPKGMWAEWLEEGNLAGDPWDEAYENHFWLAGGLPKIEPGERVYIVAHNHVRGFAPLVSVERRCRLRPSVGCLLRRNGATALTIPEPVRGFQGWRYRWWERTAEVPFPDWKQP